VQRAAAVSLLFRPLAAKCRGDRFGIHHRRHRAPPLPLV
jgi:hypothetical protein